MLPYVPQMSSSADTSIYHQPTLYLQRDGDYQWQLPAPGRDRHWHRRERPYMAPHQPPPNLRRGVTEGSWGSRRNSLSGIRPRSSTAMAARSPNECSLSPTSSIHMSSHRDLHDMRSISESIVSRTDRSGSLTKSLVSKGYKLLRRQNSKSDLTSLRTMDWMEQPRGENNLRKNSKHSRWQSTDSSMFDLKLMKPGLNQADIQLRSQHQARHLEAIQLPAPDTHTCKGSSRTKESEPE